ncbi:MAG: GYF domain-containing protein [Verrucomicrobiota bacterium]|nr:GYF domain-containing protein [Verrucomicrobiota bacterium]
MNYYLYTNNETLGPYQIEHLTEYIQSGQLTADTPCCKEGDTDWKTVQDFLPSPATAAGKLSFARTQAPSLPTEQAPKRIDPRFSHPSYWVRRKVFKLLGGAFHIYLPDGSVGFYSELKAFKLKEDIRIYTDESKQQEVLSIKARKILDFSSNYDVFDTSSGQKLGTLRRKGLKSIIKDEWHILDTLDQEIGKIHEDNLVKALVRRFLCNLIPQSYEGLINGTPVCRFHQAFNPFILKVLLDFTPDQNGLLDRRLGIAAAILLCAIEGRQD